MVRIRALYLVVISALCLLVGAPTAFAQLTTYVGTYFESTLTISNPPAGLPPCNFSTCTIQAIPGLPEGLLPAFDAAGNVRIAGVPKTVAPATAFTVYIGRKSVKYSGFPLNITVSTSELKAASNGTTQAMDTRGYNGGHPYKAQVEVLDPDNHPCSSYTPAVDAPSGLSLDKDGFLIANAIVMPAAPPISIVAQCAAPLAYSATFTVNGPAAAPAAVATTDVSDLAILALLTSVPVPPFTYVSVCNYEFNDCDWLYTMVGGGEQSDLSSQTSQTNGFIDFIVRAPENTRFGYAWTRVRLLGAPTNSNIQGIVTNVTSPTSTTTMTSLSTVGYALDYVAGFEHDFFLAKPKPKDHSGRFTVGGIVYFGATTPLNSQNATQGYAVPAFGTNECTQLQARFGAAGPTHQAGVPLYIPSLPSSGTITTTVTPTSGNPTSTVVNYCSLMNPSAAVTTTTTATGTTTVTGGTPVTNIAFSPQDRSSFLLKYAGGVRLLNRWHANGTNHCSLRARDDHMEGSDFINGPCTRSIVDLTIGQDQAITGGTLSHLVFKSDVIFPIPKSPVYFFGSAAIRLQKNENLSPLILTPTPISSGASDTTTGAITIPSPSVFVLPLKQSDRDFYRIGLAVDLSSILTKLFTEK